MFAYAEFLRKESGQSGIVPVDISQIYNHFKIPAPKLVQLPGQQGLLLDATRGIIVINSKDPPTRQKFTEAHELVEFLFNVLPNGKAIGNQWTLRRPGGFKESYKEFLCNWTAANLLMPPDYVKALIKIHGANFCLCPENIRKMYSLVFCSSDSSRTYQLRGAFSYSLDIEKQTIRDEKCSF